MRTWFITGISGGLGQSLAQAALAQGDRVVGTSRSAEAAARFSALDPEQALGLAVNLRDEAAIAAAVAQAEKWSGGIDVLVNNAGYGMTGAIEETSAQAVEALFAINLFAPLALLRAALPAMRARHAGHVIFITSVSGLAPWAGTGIYGASKFALECIGRTLAQEVAPLGLRVTNVAPGGLRTAFAGADLADAGETIPDYAETAHQARAILTAKAGDEPNDPDKAAQAILKVVSMAQPPRVLLLGADALHYAADELSALAADFARAREITLSVGIDGESQ